MEYEYKIELLQKVRDLEKSVSELYNFIECLDTDECNNIIVNSYPFEKPFEEVDCNITEWREAIQEQILNK